MTGFTPDQFRAALKRLDLTQVRLADLVNANPRTARRWAKNCYTPEAVAILLRLMLAGKITVADIERVRP